MNDDPIQRGAAPGLPRRSGAHATALPEWGPLQRAAAVAGPALTVVVLAIVILLSVDRADDARGWVAHTRDVLESTQTTLSRVQEAETGQRGYLLTGDRQYLAPYDTARLTIDADLAALRASTLDNADQQRRIDRLQPLVQAKLAELASTIERRERGDAEGAVAIVRSNRGRALMDTIRIVLGDIAASETALLTARQRREAGDTRLTFIVIIIGAAVAVMLGLLTNRLLATSARRHAGQSRLLAEQAAELSAANETLQDQAAELEIQSQQLQEQQIELEATNDHLQEQTAELETKAERLTYEEARVRSLAETEQLARQTAEHARLEAEHANRAKSQFLSTMSHELRTPLNGIGGHAQLIELGIHGPVTDAQRQALTRITRAQQHLLSLIDDILNLSRIEAGKLEYDVRETVLAEVIADVVPMVEPQLAAKRVTLAVDLTDPAIGLGSPLHVWADRDRLRQVLLNLLGNAAKFTPESGLVSLRLAARSDRTDQVVLAVSDTGYGIPADKLGAIFEPFVQAHRHMDHGGMHSVQGTGLGLAISRDLMRGMGGDIEVESAVDEGSTFLVVLRRVVAATGETVDRRTGDERRDEGERRQEEARRESDA